jgi:hypothetical protein
MNPLDPSSLCDEFEIAWSHGEKPDIDSSLPPDHPLRRELLPYFVEMEMEFAWKAGERRLAEDYLKRFPELARDGRAMANLLLQEYDLRSRTEQVALDEYRRRYPQWAGLLEIKPAIVGADGVPPARAKLTPEFFREVRERLNNVKTAESSPSLIFPIARIPLQAAAADLGRSLFVAQFQSGGVAVLIEEADREGSLARPVALTVQVDAAQSPSSKLVRFEFREAGGGQVLAGFVGLAPTADQRWLLGMVHLERMTGEPATDLLRHVSETVLKVVLCADDQLTAADVPILNRSAEATTDPASLASLRAALLRLQN